jgi:Mn2+/Fe2+ NRAMP family transporter
MPIAAAAITAVASHPRIASGFVSTNLPMTDSREAMSIIMAIIGTAATPLIMALQISAFTGSSGVKLRAAPTRVAAAIVT